MSKQDLIVNEINALSISEQPELITPLDKIPSFVTVGVSKLGDNRYFEGGAYRDTNEEKFEYDGFLHPLVVEKFAEYMHKHRKQSDGKIRDSDNWWSLFGDNHKTVCMQSGFRHFMDWWKEHRGFESRDGLDEALGGLLFNIQAYWLKDILDREKETNK